MKAWIAMLVLAVAARSAAAPARALRVCADPNNFPLSARTTRAFENEIAEILAAQLGAKVEYTWWAQRRGFYRQTLKAGSCDVVIGVPAGSGAPLVRTTAPYYRSTYVMVTRKDAHLDVSSLDDPRLAKLRIGVQLASDDGANPPPVHALARRGIIDNVEGYSVFGDYRRESPATDVMRALVAKDIDVAIAWGPVGGGFAAMSKVPLVVTPITGATAEDPPMEFSIALGVRRADAQLAAELERALAARKKDIGKLLDRWRIPRVGESTR